MRLVVLWKGVVFFLLDALGVQARFAESRRLAACLPCPQWAGADP